MRRALEAFDAQFEPDGEGFVYRRAMKDAPIRITAEERDGFADRYRRAFRRLIWGFAGTLLILILSAALLPAAQSDNANYLIMGGVVALSVPFLMVHIRLWNALARQLRGREKVGRERSRAEIKRIMLSQMSWGQLLSLTLFLPIALILLAGDRDIWHGWGLLWLVFVGVISLAMLYQLFRKWQISAGGD